MKRTFLLAMLFLSNVLFSQNEKTKMVVYCIPGQGADERLFNNLDLGEDYTLRFVNYEIPHRGERMTEYAQRLSTQINSSEPFILLGTSLGGMLATEMTEFLNPEKTIIISSAKCRSELPFRYRFQKWVPLYSIVPKGLMKFGAKVMQPIVEPDRNVEKETFQQMLEAKDKRFMKRSVAMIVHWNRETYDPSIVHIHGNNDHTLPIKKVAFNYEITDGSHMITLTRGKEISALVYSIIEN